MAEFLNFLYSHFPHRWLNKNMEGTKKLFNGLEKSIEYGNNWVKLVKRNHSIRTAEELIPELENEYGLPINPSYDNTFRKRLIISRMRAQDSPITKMDLIQMLETLGLDDCNIKNYHNEYRMSIYFRLPDDIQNRMIEARNLIEENVRAHIAFNFNILVVASVFNVNFISFYRFIILASIQNLNIKTIYLNGEKLLDGSWQLQTMTKCINLNKLKIRLCSKNPAACSQVITFCVDVKNKFETYTYLKLTKNSSVKNNINQSVKYYQNFGLKETQTNISHLITNSMWRLSGEFKLDKKKRLNAEIVKIIL